MASLHHYGRNTSLSITQTPSNTSRKGVRELDKPFSWDKITSWSSNNCPTLPSELTLLFSTCRGDGSVTPTPCPCPSFFGLQWNEELGCLLCSQHSRMIPGNFIWQHLNRSHKQKYLGINRADVFKAALSHLVGCYPKIKHQSTADVKNSLPTELTTPLSELACELSFKFRYKCPVMGCPQWTHQNTKGKGIPEADHNRHLKSHKAKDVALCRPAIAQWTQLVEIGAGRSKLKESTGDTHCFILPFQPSTATQQSLFATGSLTAPSTQSWPSSLGWEDYIKALAQKFGGRQKAVEKIRYLVALPSKKRLAKTTNKLMNALENGLLLSKSITMTYMKDGVKWVENKDYLVRARFSHSMKRPFQHFADDNGYRKYRRSLISIESFLLRSLVDELMKSPSAVLVKYSKDSRRATKDLLELILESNGNPDLEELMSKKHALYLSLLLPGSESEDKVGCPTDQVLIARSLAADGRWRKASLVRSDACQDLWCFRSVVANCCRLSMQGQTEYVSSAASDYFLTTTRCRMEEEAECQESETPPSHSKSSLADGGFDASSESESSEDEDANDSTDSSSNDNDSQAPIPTDSFNPCYIENWDIESALNRLQNLDRIETPSHTNILNDEYLDQITISKQASIITPFNRVVNVSLVLYKHSAHRPSFHTSFQEGNITLTNHLDVHIAIPLTKICMVVHRATTDFISQVKVSLPSGTAVKDLPLHLLSDDFSATPLHNQHANSKVLQPLLLKYWGQVLAGKPSGRPLYSSAGLNRIETDKWLAQYDACFPMAACAIMLNSGGVNDAAFRHQCYAGPGRTVFLLKNGTVALTNCVSSSRRIGRRVDFATLPPDLSQYLLILLIFLLPIANNLRHLKGQINPLHSTHLWILPRRHTTGRCKWGYDSNDANATLTPLTLEILDVALTGRAVCKMIWQLLSPEFPLLYHNLMILRSPVDDLAQHQYATGIRAYGRLTHFPSLSHLTGDKAIRGQTFCEIWHAFTKCGPISDMWKGLVVGSMLFPVEHFPGLAFRVARNLVLSNYGIHMGNSAPRRKQLVEDLLRTKPFLQGIENIDNKGSKIGDQVLCSVLRTFMFGSASPQSGQKVIITESIFSESASFLITALYEWSTGCFVDLSHPNSKLSEDLECLRAQITTKLVENGTRKSSQWRQLEVQVVQ
ncbi:hypothetical protein V8E53_015326 [Lactarius tabidus]